MPEATAVTAIPDTLAFAFQASVSRVPDRVALRPPGGGERITWGQHGAAVERLAGAFAELIITSDPPRLAGAATSVWVPHHINALWARCTSCGRLWDPAQNDGSCCGQRLPQGRW